MSKLYELITELCPDGVDIKNVGDICDTITDYTAAGSFADVAKNVKYINDGVGYAQLIRTLASKFGFRMFGVTECWKLRGSILCYTRYTAFFV